MPREGRVFGGIVLAAFVLYGIGSGSADQPVGMTLVVLNSIAVTVAGAIGYRLLRSSDRGVGLGYLAARLAEAVRIVGISVNGILDLLRAVFTLPRRLSGRGRTSH